ncbi:MAG: DUF692 domain-containing protein [Proteobacteria bacterium]|nr:DUF692 domain-containing protein [Pseudomonadota bacterium]
MKPSNARGLPARTGIGFKPQHFADVLADDGAVLGFLEVHAENYMGDGGPFHAQLAALSDRFPISLHGVGLSIGGEAPLDEVHLERLAQLIERYRPASFSEHLAWSSHGLNYFNDLLPIAYDTASLRRVEEHIDQVQNRLGCRMLLENPSTYVAFAHSTWDEVDFIAEIARRTACGLLLDVNNVAVTSINQGRDPVAYIDAFPVAAVGEIHLAGHAEDHDDAGDRILIDSHDRPVSLPVWDLYRRTLSRVGPVATLIEWDNEVPAFDVLLAEAERAGALLDAEAARRNQS